MCTLRVLSIIACLVASLPHETRAESYIRIGTSPRDTKLSTEGANSNEAQGIAFSGSHFYYSNRWTIFRLSTEFRETDVGIRVAPLRLPFGLRVASLYGGLRFGEATCDHVGGIDFYDGELYAALESCSDHRARIVVFDRGLRLKRSAVLPELSGDMENCTGGDMEKCTTFD
jgi:hypothetical protein